MNSSFSCIYIILIILSIVLALMSFMTGYFTFKRNAVSDNKQSGRESWTVMSDLGYIKSSIERIEKLLGISDAKYDGISTRLTRVEESASSAHKRLDEHFLNKRTIAGRSKKDE